MKEESQHAVLDEMEWQREDAKITPAERDKGVNDLIDLVAAVDGILQVQATADAEYFTRVIPRKLDKAETQQIRESLLAAYRWQYIVSGVMEPRFQKTLFGLVNAGQRARIEAAMAPLAYAVPTRPEMALPMAA
jgi:hypothetical protein